MTLHTKLFNDNNVVKMLTPAVYNTDQLSAKVDMQDYSDLLIILDVGASGDTWSATNKIEFEVQDSADDSTYAATADANVTNPVASSTATGTIKTLNANAQGSNVYVAAYKGGKRYVKVNVNFSGTHSTGSPIGVIGVQGMSRAMPVNS